MEESGTQVKKLLIIATINGRDSIFSINSTIQSYLVKS